MTDKREPYIGPRPFKKDDGELFFGRDQEADELVSLITAHPVVLLYAQSGSGKSSLLNARVIPKLESDDEGFEVLGPLRVQGQIPANFVVDKDSNIYILNALLSYDQNADPSRLSRLTLSDYLQQRPPRVNKFNEPSPRVIIFDQFEEIFTAYTERWEQRMAFFEQVRNAIEGDRVPLRVVFAMREDYIAELDPYVSILPEKLRTRYRLEQLRKEPALLAVTKPLKGTGRSYGKDVAEQLVDNLRRLPGTNADDPKLGPYVEPVQLQVVCQSIWQALGPGETEITQNHLKDYGDVNRALSAFYERSVKTVCEKTGTPEADLRDWFGNTLITEEGRRTPVYRGAQKTEGLANAAVEMLDSMQLIKSELKGANDRWYELAHDRFIEPVRQSNERWLAQQSADAQALRRLKNKAVRWRQGDGPVLTAVEVVEAKRLLRTQREQNEDLRALIDASQVSAQRRRLKLMTGGVIALSVVLILMGGLSYYAFAQRRASEQAMMEAGRQKAEAERQRDEVDRQRDEVERQKLQRAELASKAAEMQRMQTQEALVTLEAEKKKTVEQREAAVAALALATVEKKRAMNAQQVAEAQLKVIKQQQELLAENRLDPNTPVEITSDTAPAFKKIKDDVAYATTFLNSLLGMNLDPPEVLPLSNKDRNAYWDTRVLHEPPIVAELPDVSYAETSYAFIQGVISKVPYTAEAQAIRASYSRIYASLIKQHKLGQTAEEADWVIAPGGLAWWKGEDVATSKDKSPLISLKNPGTAFNDPVIGKDAQIAHMRDVKEGIDPGGSTDLMYSGVPNKAFYETAIRIGSRRAGVIWTAALKDPGLPGNMTFKNLAQITYDVAVKLHGDNSAESRAVKDAWNVVGVAVN
jgi:hypothetical protein